MRRVLVSFLLAAAVVSGCTGPSKNPGLADSPPPAEKPPGVRVTAQSSGDVITNSPDLWVWAEEETQPPLSRLLADPAEGVWGGQDGELFHFRVRADKSFGRVTYGRPDPAAIWAGDLVWVSDRQLAGRVTTRHLIRKSPDGKVSDLASARSPGGVPFDLLDWREGKLHLRDRLGTWYTTSEGGAGFEPVQTFTSGKLTGSVSPGEREQQEFARAAGGRVHYWIVPGADGISYALIDREDLFLFDVGDRKFTLLEQPGLTPVASLNGQVVARYDGGLALVDLAAGSVRQFPVEMLGQGVFPLADGWFFIPPVTKLNLTTGEEKRLTAGLPLGGAVTALLPLDDQRMVGGTEHFGSLFLLDPATGEVEMWGRPLPELGQESGEEVAPIDGLALGKDGFLYAAIGSGASARPGSHLVRLDRTGKVVAKSWLPEPVHHLVVGADGRLYGSGRARVVVIPLEGQIR